MTYAEECDAALKEDIIAFLSKLHDLHKGSPQFWEKEKIKEGEACTERQR